MLSAFKPKGNFPDPATRAANTYLRLTAKHKPAMLKAAGSNLEVASWTNQLFWYFGAAMSGDTTALAWIDSVFSHLEIPDPLILNALADMSVEAHQVQAAV